MRIQAPQTKGGNQRSKGKLSKKTPCIHLKVKTNSCKHIQKYTRINQVIWLRINTVHWNSEGAGFAENTIYYCVLAQLNYALVCICFAIFIMGHSISIFTWTYSGNSHLALHIQRPNNSKFIIRLNDLLRTESINKTLRFCIFVRHQNCSTSFINLRGSLKINTFAHCYTFSFILTIKMDIFMESVCFLFPFKIYMK